MQAPGFYSKGGTVAGKQQGRRVLSSSPHFLITSLLSPRRGEERRGERGSSKCGRKWLLPLLDARVSCGRRFSPRKNRLRLGIKSL